MKRRNPIVVIILSVVTFGIYDLYWLISTRRVLNKSTKFHIPTIWLLYAPAVLVIAGYVGIFLSAAFQNKTNMYGQTQITNTGHTGMFFAFSAVVFIGFISVIIVTAYWFLRFSKAVNQYTNGKMNTAVTFLLLWAVHLIGVALVQDSFNDMLTTNTEGTPPVPSYPVGTPQSSDQGASNGTAQQQDPADVVSSGPQAPIPTNQAPSPEGASNIGPVSNNDAKD